MSKCPICLIVLSGAPYPCEIAPRVYVGSYGYIEAVIPGCPYEVCNTPDYLPMRMLVLDTDEEDDNDKLSKDALKRFKEIAQSLHNGHYQDLWAAGDGENNHLDFDPRRRTQERLAAIASGLSNVQSLGFGRSEESYLQAIRRTDTGERTYVVPDDTLGVLQTARTRKTPTHVRSA